MNEKINQRNRFLLSAAFVLLLIAIVCRPISNLPGISGGAWDIRFTKIRSFIYMGLYIGWTVTVYRRIIQRQTRNLLICIGLLAFFWIALRTVKWFYVSDTDAVRFLWYLYYLPMNMMPTLGVYMAVSVGKPERWRLPRWAWIFVGISLLLTAGILLNDSHQLAFRFLTPVWNEDDIAYGPVYWCNIVWEIICGLTAIVLLFIKCRLPYKKQFLILPFIPALCSIIYGFTYILRIPVLMLLAGDITAFQCLFFVATMECCIRCGLIRSNTGYEELFSLSRLRAIITDREYRVVLSSKNSIDPTPEQMRETETAPVALAGGLQLSGAPIRSGHVFWEEDVSELTEVLSELEDVSSYLEGKREVLEKEYETSREQQKAVEKNRLYNKIMTETDPQIRLYAELVERLDKADEQEEIRYLVSRIALVCAYIKRRDNLIFLDEGNEPDAGREMEYCLEETVNAIRLCRVECQYSVELSDTVGFAELAGLYEAFFTAVMASLDTLSVLLVSVNEMSGKPMLTLRLACDSDLSTLALPDAEIERAEDGFVITVTAKKGGGTP